MLIAIEGIDAAGKNTQSNNLLKHFKDAGCNTTLLSFPHYDSITGEMIRGHLVGDWRAELSEIARTRLYDSMPTYMQDPGTYLFQCCQLVNRMETLPDALWERHPGSKDVYIADRYNASAYAYGIAFGLDFDWLVRTHKHLPQPDVNVFLDITVEESFRRRPERRDNYEKNSGLLNRVRESYLEVFKKLGSSYVVIDASGTEAQTFEKIMDVVEGIPR